MKRGALKCSACGSTSQRHAFRDPEAVGHDGERYDEYVWTCNLCGCERVSRFYPWGKLSGERESER